MKQVFIKQFGNFNDVLGNIVKILLLSIILTACDEKKEVKVYPDMYNVGYSTNIAIGEYASVKSLGAAVIDQKAFYDGEPTRITINNLSTQEAEIIAAENALSYAKSLSGKLKASSGLGLFKSSISYFDSLTFRSDYIFSSYNLFIRQKSFKINASTDILKKYLTADFKVDIQTQSPAEIVRHYGTHVIINLVTGGKFVALYRARTSSTDRKSAASAGLSVAVKKLFDLDISGGVNSSYAATNTDQQLYYYAVGGSSSIPLVGEVTLGPVVPNTIQIGTWQKSVTPDNSVLIDFGDNNSLIPLYDLIPDATKAAEVKKYIEQYLLDNQVKMVEAPPAVFEYYDGRYINWGYSLKDEPLIYGRLALQGAVFRAYASQVNGAVGIYEYLDPSLGDLIYTAETNPNLPGYTNQGIKFYAFNKPTSGAKPVYQFFYHAKINKKIYLGHHYSLDNKFPGSVDWGYDGIAFYAYSL